MAFTDAIANSFSSSSSSGSSSGSGSGEYCDISKAQTKHWKLVVASSTRARIMELTTPDLKTILITNNDINRHMYNELPLLKKYQVARFNGNEDDFDRVLRYHPMRGGQYSATFNNCQHFVANFLLLLQALAKEDHQKSFEGNDLYRTMVDSVMDCDKSFVWNSPNLYLELTRLGIPTALLPVSYASFLAADAAAGATVTTVTSIPATGIMGWLGAAPTVTVTTVAAPSAAAAATVAAFAAAGVWAAFGGVCAYKYQCYLWKGRTKVKHPLVSGFPRGHKPKLSASELL